MGPFKNTPGEKDGGVYDYYKWAETPSSVYWMTFAADADNEEIGGSYLKDINANLIKDETGQVKVTINPKKSGDYKVQIFNGENLLSPNWDWANTKSQVVSVEANTDYTFSFNVIPDTEVEEFAFWIYKESWIPGIFFIKEKVVESLYAEEKVVSDSSPETPFPINPDLNETLINLTPEFIWSSFNSPIGANQSGYQIRVRCDDEGDRIIYETGFISSTNSTHLFTPGGYAGIESVTGLERVSNELKPGMKYHWHVRVRDEAGNWSNWSADEPGNYQFFYTPVPENTAPVITNQSFSIDENSGFGDLIGKVLASDEDQNSLVYSLIGGDFESIELDAETGDFFVSVSDYFNYEEKAFFNFNISVEDDGVPSKSNEALITVIINDVNDKPHLSNLEITPSNAYVNDALEINYTYSDEDGNTESGTTIWWYLNGSRINELDDQRKVSASYLNGGDNWDAIVHPSDGIIQGDKYKSNTIVVGSVNHPPIEISISNSTIDENKNIGSTIGQFSTVDQDVGDTHVYSLTNSRLDNTLFTIDENGTLRTSSVFDFESKENYEIEVQSTDNNDASVLAIFYIIVSDVNEAPVVSQVTINPDNPFESVDLELSYLYSDIENDLDQSKIYWFRNGILIDQYNNQKVIPNSELNAGEKWLAKVEPYDGISAGQIAQSIEVTINEDLECLTVNDNIPTKIPASGGNYSINVNSTENYTYQFIWNNEQLAIGLGVAGESQINIQIPENSGTQSRTGQIIIQACNKEIVLPNFQEGIESSIRLLITNPDTNIEFGGLALNTTKDKIIELHNTGSSVVNISNLSIDGNDESMYAIISPTADSFDIPSGSSQKVVVRFTPNSEGEKQHH